MVRKALWYVTPPRTSQIKKPNNIVGGNQAFQAARLPSWSDLSSSSDEAVFIGLPILSNLPAARPNSDAMNPKSMDTSTIEEIDIQEPLLRNLDFFG